MSTIGLAERDHPAALDEPRDPRRWLALAIVSTAQLMVILDATIVNIALPQAQAALQIADADRSWVLTAYTLTFGGLLLLGGRVADFWGRKRTFLLGLTGFALASALGGLAGNGETLFAARALQGAFGALLAPASLALLTVLFTEPRERARAFGVYGAIAGGGAAVGLVLGGVLTEYLDWRWCLLVNVPIAALAGVAALFGLRESRASGRASYDVGGAVLITVGLAGLVYGFTQAADPDYGWTHIYTLTFIIVSLLFLAGFVVVEHYTPRPLLPLRILLERSRAGAFTASLLAGAGVFGASLFMTFYFQEVLAFTPVQAGVATLPITAGVLLAFPFAATLLTRWGARPLMAAGSFVAAGGLLLFTRIGLENTFWSTVLPAELVLGLGLGLIFVPLSNIALAGVSHADAGAASAVVNASQQVGSSLGVAALSALALQAGNAYAASHLPASPELIMAFVSEVKVHSYRVGFAWGAAFLAVAGVVVLILVRTGKLPKSPTTMIHMG